MFKLGDRITKEEFIKYAPYGLVLQYVTQQEYTLYYNLKEFNQCSNTMKLSAKHDMLSSAGFYKPGYMWKNAIELKAPIMSGWDFISSLYVVKTLPTKSIRLKRKNHV